MIKYTLWVRGNSSLGTDEKLGHWSDPDRARLAVLNWLAIPIEDEGVLCFTAVKGTEVVYHLEGNESIREHFDVED